MPARWYLHVPPLPSPISIATLLFFFFIFCLRGVLKKKKKKNCASASRSHFALNFQSSSKGIAYLPSVQFGSLQEGLFTVPSLDLFFGTTTYSFPPPLNFYTVTARAMKRIHFYHGVCTQKTNRLLSDTEHRPSSN